MRGHPIVRIHSAFNFDFFITQWTSRKDIFFFQGIGGTIMFIRHEMHFTKKAATPFTAFCKRIPLPTKRAMTTIYLGIHFK